ncbi:MAG TPA: ATP-binding protein [Vicinamibacterales bacterium]|nr:ATP-binding protein [Vicinamibacterales bacterium]
MTPRRARFCAALVLFVNSRAFSAAAAEPRHVLLLYSYEREFIAGAFATQFRDDLLRSSADPINFIEVALQATPTSEREPDAVLLENLRSAFSGKNLDLVVPLGGPAAVFAQRYKNDVFPNTPILLASVDSRFLGTGGLPPDETAVAVHHDPRLMIESILRLLPETQTVVVVIGASIHEQFWVQELKRAFRPYESRVRFVWTNDWTYAELLHRCSSLPPHSAILFGLLMLDANGVPQREEEALDALHQTANAPIFGLHSPQLGHGIVGGPLVSYESLSRDTADVALRLLRGTPARDIAARTVMVSAPVFDGRELRRWGIAEGRLEPGSVVRFPDSNRWKRWPASAAIGSAVAGFVLFATILASRRAGSVQQTQAGPAVAKLTQRLMQTQEEDRASFARWIEDDVCQRLAALSIDLQELGEAAPESRTQIRGMRERVSELTRETLALPDPIYARLNLLGLVATSRTFCERRCAEHHVALHFAEHAMPADLPRNATLTLFRVLQESVENALRHSKTPRLLVSFSLAAEIVMLDVADCGVGFDQTTDCVSEGVGLVAMRERVRAIGGACIIESRPGAGTRVCAFVRV